MRLETLRRGAMLKIHEIAILQSQMFSLPIHPAWMLSDCRMAFILDRQHTTTSKGLCVKLIVAKQSGH